MRWIRISEMKYIFNEIKKQVRSTDISHCSQCDEMKFDTIQNGFEINHFVLIKSGPRLAMVFSLFRVMTRACLKAIYINILSLEKATLDKLLKANHSTTRKTTTSCYCMLACLPCQHAIQLKNQPKITLLREPIWLIDSFNYFGILFRNNHSKEFTNRLAQFYLNRVSAVWIWKWYTPNIWMIN